MLGDGVVKVYMVYVSMIFFLLFFKRRWVLVFKEVDKLEISNYNIWVKEDD